MPKKGTRGNIEKRGEDQYRIRIFIGRDATEKPLYHRETICGTWTQANQRLTNILKELDDGAYIEPSKVTVGQYLDRWMRDYVAAKRPKTKDTYENMLKYITPTLGHLQLQKLRPYNIQALYRELLEDGRIIRKQGKADNATVLPPTLSPTTVNKIHRTLHAALEMAVQWDLIIRNPADRVKAPQPQKRRMQVWTNEELTRFLGYMSGHRLYALYALVTATGLRRGEVAGLRWADVDTEKCTISIQQTVIVVKGKQEIQPMPKTDASEATMQISPVMVDILHRHKLAQQQERWGWQDQYEDNGLVFCQDNGKPLRVDNLGKRDFPNLCKKAQVPVIRFHDLRHTYATYLFGQGYSAPDVQRRLRHSRASTTVDMYGHSLPETQRQAAISTDAILPRNVPEKRTS